MQNRQKNCSTYDSVVKLSNLSPSDSDKEKQRKGKFNFCVEGCAKLHKDARCLAYHYLTSHSDKELERWHMSKQVLSTLLKQSNKYAYEVCEVCREYGLDDPYTLNNLKACQLTTSYTIESSS